MNPLERAKLRIEEDVARRRREQQARLNSQSTTTQDSNVSDQAMQHFTANIYEAQRAACANVSHIATDTGSSSSSDSCSSTSYSSDY
jgi:hypothetical protein